MDTQKSFNQFIANMLSKKVLLSNFWIIYYPSTLYMKGMMYTQDHIFVKIDKAFYQEYNNKRDS